VRARPSSGVDRGSRSGTEIGLSWRTRAQPRRGLPCRRWASLRRTAIRAIQRAVPIAMVGVERHRVIGKRRRFGVKYETPTTSSVLGVSFPEAHPGPWRRPVDPPKWTSSSSPTIRACKHKRLTILIRPFVAVRFELPKKLVVTVTGTERFRPLHAAMGRARGCYLRFWPVSRFVSLILRSVVVQCFSERTVSCL
jgi:hypothetical protein